MNKGSGIKILIIIVIISAGMFMPYSMGRATTLTDLVIDGSGQTYFSSTDTLNATTVTITSSAQNVIFCSEQDIVLGNGFIATEGCSFIAHAGGMLGVLSGRVTSNGFDTGLGMEGVTVTFTDPTTGLVFSVTTDEDGYYSVIAPFGNYNITLSSGSNAYLFSNQPVSVSLDGQSVAVAAAQAVPLDYNDSITYTFDDLNRLKKAQFSNGNVIEYTYDEAGNRTQKTTTP